MAEKEPWWVMTREEQRVLAITFLGGLGSIIAGACLIGAALAFDRTQLKRPIHPWSWGLLITGTLFFWWLTWAYGRDVTRRRDALAQRRGSRWAILSGFVGLGVLDLIMLLIWVGAAAGIK